MEHSHTLFCVSVRVSIAGIKHNDQKQLGRKDFILACSPSWREVRPGTEAEVMKEHCLLAWPPVPCSFWFLIYPAKGWHQPSLLNQEDAQQACPQVNLMEAFSYVYWDDRILCQVDKKKINLHTISQCWLTPPGCLPGATYYFKHFGNTMVRQSRRYYF